MKKQILALEQQDAEKAAEAKKKEQELEKSMRKELLSKDKIQQDYYRLQREKDQVEQEYALRLEQIQQNLNMLDKKYFDIV